MASITGRGAGEMSAERRSQQDTWRRDLEQQMVSQQRAKELQRAKEREADRLVRARAACPRPPPVRDV